MKNDNTRIWRLALPDDWEPDGVWCVSFQIPAGDQYVEALAAVLGLLTISKTFERDETHSGASTVAQTWKRVLMLAPMQVNQDCQAQPEIPIPDAAAARDAAAAFFTQWWQPRIAQINTCATVAADCAGCVDDIMTEMIPYGSSDTARSALLNMCTHLTELTPAERAEYEDDCIWLPAFEEIATNIENNPFDWLQKMPDWMSDFAARATDSVMGAVWAVSAQMAGFCIWCWMLDNGGIPEGGGAGFGGACAWEHVIDFTVTAGDFVTFNSGGSEGGVWISAEGWQNLTPPPNEEVIFIHRVLPTFHCTHLEFSWNQTIGYASYQGAVIAVKNDGTTVMEARDNSLANVPATLGAFGSVTADEIALQINVLDDTPQPVQRVVECKVQGIGFNPFT